MPPLEVLLNHCLTSWFKVLVSVHLWFKVNLHICGFGKGYLVRKRESIGPPPWEKCTQQKISDAVVWGSWTCKVILLKG